MKKNFLLSLIFLCSLASIAQPPCAFDIKHNELMAKDPNYARTVAENDNKIKAYIASHPQQNTGRVSTTYNIPIVVHVLHTGGAVGTIYNPTDAQIQGAISYLNAIYNGTHPTLTAPSPTGAAGDLGLQFVFAQRTPACGPTNGIDRVDASSLPGYTTYGVNSSNTNGCPEQTLKDFARWDVTQYYNIYVVNKIDGADGTSGQFVAGYAYYPGAGSLDGTIMLATQMKDGAKTLPHEIGHAFSLRHPFQGSTINTSCPVNNNCNTDGDLVCDTDPITYDAPASGVLTFACRTGTNTCTGTAYSINTESNFMSYTSCYTLFTNGQKARITAALSLPDRVTLINSPAGNLCGPFLNFAISTDTKTETTTTTTGCRRYTDYTYQMFVGTAPTAATTATLTFGGTATKGIDYDVTTNGSFTSPSNVLNFAVGSTTTQTFTLRLYDDDNVENAETIILDFIINNGGGNIVKGTNAPTLTITLNDNDIAPTGATINNIQVGGTTNNLLNDYASGNADPVFNQKLATKRVQIIYKASELIAAGISAGQISGIQFNILAHNAASRPFQNMVVKMGATNFSYLIDGGLNVLSGLTTVKNAFTFTTATGWNPISFDYNFTWNGTSNIGVEICYNNGTADAAQVSDATSGYLDGGTVAQANMDWSDIIDCSVTFAPNLYLTGGFGEKPTIKLTLGLSGTPVETVAAATRSNYIDVGSNDYFYSNNNKLMIKLGSIGAQLGCVSSTVEEAGNTWLSLAGGQRSGKVFLVTPTTNTATGTYNIALYFTNAELGGKTASTLKIAKTNAASASLADGSNTVIVAPTVTTLGSNTNIFSANFTGFSRFFLVDANVGLPINLVDFSARLDNNQNSLLNWTTSSEQNNNHFEVEVSRNSIDFALLGNVSSKGNSSSTQVYSLVHVKPQTGITYYRLKQVDNDGKFVYSKIISINMDKKGGSTPIIYPVPAKDVVTINFGNIVSNTKIMVYSTDMKLVLQEDILGLAIKKDLNISQLPIGVYFVKIAGNGNTDLLRFIKE